MNFVNEMKVLIAKWLQKMKVKSPIVFVAIIGSLYGYTFLLDPTAITDWGLTLFHADMNSIPYHEVITFLTNSKFVTGAVLALVGGHTTGILTAAKEEKKTS